MYHVIHWYAEANIKYTKDYDTNKESSFLMCWGINNFYGWAMWQKLPVDGFKWRKDKFIFDEVFIQDYGEEADKGYISEVFQEAAQAAQWYAVLTQKNENL